MQGGCVTKEIVGTVGCVCVCVCVCVCNSIQGDKNYAQKVH